jgi:hypothetical protein
MRVVMVEGSNEAEGTVPGRDALGYPRSACQSPWPIGSSLIVATTIREVSHVDYIFVILLLLAVVIMAAYFYLRRRQQQTHTDTSGGAVDHRHERDATDATVHDPTVDTAPRDR